MFGGLFGKKSAARLEEDRVWKTAAACRMGLCRQAVEAITAGRGVIVVCLAPRAFDAMDTALAPHQPTHCRDLFGRDALRAALARSGALVIALSGSLPQGMPVRGPMDVLVLGRNASRSADDAIKHFADALGPQATLAFYLSMEDELLKPFVASSLQLFEQLGMKDDEALSNSMLTRAIANCQAA
jgi:preprotein translocase subunit SecA